MNTYNKDSQKSVTQTTNTTTSGTQMLALTDLDPMKFGKYKGTVLQDVPASYLHWIWHNTSTDSCNGRLYLYIRRSISALKEEEPDLVWDMSMRKEIV